MTDFCFV